MCFETSVELVLILITSDAPAARRQDAESGYGPVARGVRCARHLRRRPRKPRSRPVCGAKYECDVYRSTPRRPYADRQKTHKSTRDVIDIIIDVNMITRPRARDCVWPCAGGMVGLRLGFRFVHCAAANRLTGEAGFR